MKRRLARRSGVQPENRLTSAISKSPALFPPGGRRSLPVMSATSWTRHRVGRSLGAPVRLRSFPAVVGRASLGSLKISGMLTVALLFCSNTFMTIAWYGHLRFRDRPLMLVIVVSWLIAFAEYCFQVPANRIGYWRIHRLPFQDHPGDINAGSLRDLRLLLSGRSAAMELCRIVRMHPRRSRIRVLGRNLGFPQSRGVSPVDFVASRR